MATNGSVRLRHDGAHTAPQGNELVECAGVARATADQMAANQSGMTVDSFHTAGHDLARTFTEHADRYFAMSRASKRCGHILSGLRIDLDRIDAHAHAQIDPLMRRPNAVARAIAIQIIATARADAIAASTAAATEISEQGSNVGITPSKNPDHDATVQLIDHQVVKDAPPLAEQRANQAAAFRQIYGHDPVTANDWQMAAVLDPHSYDPRTQGKNPEIRVVRIDPVPGQGLVRVSQWIEQRDVSNVPPSRDLGNNRSADPHFDPANTKVTTYIDYDNGLVVMRQNPSIEENDTGGPGQARVRAPQGTVTQTPDGAVRIQYNAGNPFAPDIATAPPGPLADHAWTVNGDLVFTPGPGGVRVDGTRTDYPSLEVYQDLPGAGTRTVLVDPAQSGRSWGPFANLPFHHDVGIGGRAFEPFDRGGWNPRYDVPVPLPSTEFGPVTAPPSVPPKPAGTATTA